MDLNIMMREQARNGLQSRLDAAVTNGDTAEAAKVAKELETLAVATAPKAPAFGDAEIRAELNKTPWFGTDPKKSGLALSLGKDMDPKKFPSAEAFAVALIKAVDDETKPVTPKPEDADEEDETDEEREAREAAEAGAKAAGKKPRRSDGPSEGDANVRSRARTSSGPWTKMSDAPPDIQKEINRTADKFLSSNASKEAHETFKKNALASHWNAAQQKKGK